MKILVVLLFAGIVIFGIVLFGISQDHGAHGRAIAAAVCVLQPQAGDNDERIRFVAVLEIPPVVSAGTAVRVQMVKDFKGSKQKLI
jgi:hypothetical protein